MPPEALPPAEGARLPLDPAQPERGEVFLHATPPKALALRLSVFGQALLADPGPPMDGDPAWREYIRHSRAWNLAMPLDATQAWPAPGKPAAALTLPSVSGPVFSHVYGESGELYTQGAPGVIARRDVIVVHPDYVLLADVLVGAALAGMLAHFHFPPVRVEPVRHGKGVRTVRPHGPNLDLCPLEPRAGLHLALVCGAGPPLQGWLARGGECVPAPVAQYRVKGAGPARAVLALAPYLQGARSGIKFTRLSNAPPGVFGIKAAYLSGKTDRIWLRRETRARLPRRGAPLDADVFVERLDAGGKLLSRAWLAGRTMTVQA